MVAKLLVEPTAVVHVTHANLLFLLNTPMSLQITLMVLVADSITKTWQDSILPLILYMHRSQHSTVPNIVII